MKKIVLIIFIIFALASAGIYLYINQVFLPFKLKEIITTKLQETLGRKITYDSIDYHFLKGIDIHNLTILDKDSPDVFLTVERISFNVLLTGIIKNQAIVIPSLSITSPNINIKKQSQTAWNFSDLIKEKSNDAPSGLPFEILIRKIIIQNGKANLQDTNTETKFNESLENINLLTILHLNKTADIEFSAIIPEKKSTIELNGRFDIKNKLLQSNISLKNISLADYLKQFFQLPSLSIDSGNLTSAELNLTYSPKEIKAQGSLNLNKVSLAGNALNAQSQPPFKTFKGDVALHSFIFNKTENQSQAQALVDIKDALIQLNDSQLLEGNITAELTSLTMDQTTTQLKGKLKIDQSKLAFGNARQLTGQLIFNNIILDKTNTNTSLKMDATLQNGHVELSPSQIIDGNISLFRTELNFKDKLLSLKTDLELQNAIIKASDKISIRGTLTAPKLTAELNNSILSLDGNLRLDTGQIQIDELKKFTGNPQIHLNLETNLTDPSTLVYSGMIHLDKTTLTGLPQVSEITNLSGDINFQNDYLKTDQLIFKTVDTDFNLSGNLTSFAKPLINIEITSENLNFENIVPILPQELMQKVPAQITGRSSIKLNVKGLLANLTQAEISCQAYLKSVNISTSKLPSPINDLSGQINVAKNLLLWKDLEGVYLNKKYKSTGKIFEFTAPSITASLTSDQLSLNADISTKNTLLEINELKGKFLNSVFYVTGSIDQFNSPNSNVSLKVDSSINLKDLNELPLSITEKIKTFNLYGEITFASTITGNGMDWRLWDVDLKAQSPRIIAFNYPVETFKLSYHQNNGEIDLFESTANLYNGSFKLQAKGKIKDPNIPLEMAAELNRLNLETLRKDQKLKLSNLQGMLTLDLVVNGPLLKPALISGTGNITISEGILWEFDVLKGIFGLLLIPEFQNIIFTDAHAYLTIADKKITTQNAELISKNVTLNGSGWVDFNQNIDFDVNPTFSEISILSSDSLRKAPTSFLAQSIAIHVTGTLKEPKFRSDTSVKKVLQNTTNVITDGVKSILDEVF